jgi:hypothetical protein
VTVAGRPAKDHRAFVETYQNRAIGSGECQMSGAKISAQF